MAPAYAVPRMLAARRADACRTSTSTRSTRRSPRRCSRRSRRGRTRCSARSGSASTRRSARSTARSSTSTAPRSPPATRSPRPAAGSWPTAAKLLGPRRARGRGADLDLRRRRPGRRRHPRALSPRRAATPSGRAAAGLATRRAPWRLDVSGWRGRARWRRGSRGPARAETCADRRDAGGGLLDQDADPGELERAEAAGVERVGEQRRVVDAEVAGRRRRPRGRRLERRPGRRRCRGRAGTARPRRSPRAARGRCGASASARSRRTPGGRRRSRRRPR